MVLREVVVNVMYRSSTREIDMYRNGHVPIWSHPLSRTSLEAELYALFALVLLIYMVRVNRC